MKRAKDLSREDLERIVDAIQEQMYLCLDDNEYYGDMDVNGGDLVEAVGEAMSVFGLVPMASWEDTYGEDDDAPEEET